MQFTEFIRQLEISTRKSELQKKIERLIETTLTINSNKGGTGITSELSYCQSGYPKIIVKYNNDLIAIHTYSSIEDIYASMALSVRKKPPEFYISLLLNAGYKSQVLPEGYPIHMSDLSISDIQNISDDMIKLKEISHDIHRSIPEIEINLRSSGDKIEYWYRAFISYIQYENGYYPVNPIQSIMIDSSIDYELYPNMILNYRKY